MVNKIFNIKMAQCADGFLVNTKYLDKIQSFYKKFVLNNNNMFYDDDLWFAIYLQLVKKTKIIKLLEIFQKKTGKNVIYENQNASDSLNKTIHGPHNLMNRRKIQKIEFIKNNIPVVNSMIGYCLLIFFPQQLEYPER